ncbi:MAG: bifunctional diaminohydroxyphosphoribosylaminopyrimidine deaminase/5-amino-6-(5-phosphoribosylamino)uracil reductase RibD [Verrucomicrobia bacterium]|nr:bifunctional diaminohydroxyphosphoribosylaminopyrimidine deaminase/5-amino-6-(5-phosphoribosylamino)uracil reductase RibD [Verrucomicrobiota bacterium]
MKSHGTAQRRSQSDERFMRLAIKEAARALGLTAPNPAVGAVIVKNGRLLAKGYHRAAALPHAEIDAIRKLIPDFSLQPSAFSPMPRPLTGSTLYVTLEPCSSHGKTPPCTGAIIAAGISRVVYGARDPDKRHLGRATKILRKAGIEVTEGVLAEECAALNAHWNNRNTRGLPWVIAKAGMSLDGRIDSPPHRRWITSTASRKETMHLRASVEAILVGGGTVRTDDPSLTIRGIKLAKNHPQPWRVVWSRSGKIPKKSKLLADAHRDRTLVFTGMTLRKVLQELGKRGISSVLIEGGGHTLGEAFDRNLVDEVRFFIAPVIQGGTVPAVEGHGRGSRAPTIQLTDVIHKKIGSDVMVSGKVLRKQKSRL